MQTLETFIHRVVKKGIIKLSVRPLIHKYLTNHYNYISTESTEQKLCKQRRIILSSGKKNSKVLEFREMAEKKSILGRVDLPIPLNEFPNLSPLEAAQAYTLQLLELTELKKDDTEGVTDLKKGFLNWLSNFTPEERVPGPIAAYQDVLKSANRIIPFIKSDVQRLMKKKGSNLSYSSTISASEKSSGKSSGVFEADAFLYENIDEPLEEQGQESEIQCMNCKSTDCCEIDTEIDFSTSVNSLAKLFTLLEENPVNEEPKILVIGSGIGSVAYGAFLFFGKAKTILSCEWEQRLHQLQKEVTTRHGMTGKVSVDNCICPQDPGIIKSSDLVIICRRISKLTAKQIGELFQTLKENMKGGSILVICAQDIQSYTMQFGQVEMEKFRDWLQIKYQIGNSSNYDNFNSDSDDYKLKYYIYTVM